MEALSAGELRESELQNSVVELQRKLSLMESKVRLTQDACLSVFLGINQSGTNRITAVHRYL